MGTFADLQQAIKDLPDADYRVFTSSAKPATEAEIAALEAQIGRPIPPALRELYATWGVLVVEVLDSVWPRPTEHEVLPAWRFAYSFIVLGVGAAIPPDLAVASAITPEMLAVGAAPLLRPMGARFLFVTSTTGVGSWQPGDAEIEPFNGDAIDCILFAIKELAAGITRLRTAELSADDLMKQGREVGWKGPPAAYVVDCLKKRPAAELAPHLSELVDALLPARKLSMGCLDVIAAAGPAAFGPVAERVYAHYELDDQAYVLELLGKVGDKSPKAIALYRAGLQSDDGEFSYAVDAVKALHATALIPTLEARLGDELETEARGTIIALLGHLGATYVPHVTALLDHLTKDGDFSAFLRALGGLPVAETTLAPTFLERYRKVDPKSRGAIEVIEALVALGIEDRATMEPTLREHFVPRGGRWTTRAEAILATWK